MRYDAADKWLRTRLQMPTALNSKGLALIAPAIRANAFFSAQVAVGHVLDTLRDVSDRFTKGGMDLATARLELKRRLGRQHEPGTPEDRKLSDLASTARLDLILRQNARMAMAVGEYQQGMDPMTRKMFPYWRYVQSASASPRGAHRQYWGKVYRKDDPIWHRIFPPSEFNCKCSVEEVAADEVAPSDVEKPLPDMSALPPVPPSGFSFDPADALKVIEPNCIKDETLRESTVRELLDKDMLPEGGIIGKRTPVHTLQFLTKMPSNSMVPPEDAAVIPDSARKKQLISEIDEILGHLASLEGRETEKAEKLPTRTINVGDMLPSHRKMLGLPFAHIVLESPGNVDKGFKHWIKKHKATLKGAVIVELFERTIWNPLIKPIVVNRGGKHRLVYEWKDSAGNALCGIFDLKDGNWSVIDAWVPSDEYFEGVLRNREQQQAKEKARPPTRN